MKTFERVGNFLQVAIGRNKDSLELWPIGSFTVSINKHSITLGLIDHGSEFIRIDLANKEEVANEAIKELEEALK